MNDTPDIEADYRAVRALCIALACLPLLFAIPAILTLGEIW